MGQEPGISSGDGLPVPADCTNLSGPLFPLYRRLQNFSGRIVRDPLVATIIGQKQFPHDQPIWAERGNLAHLFVIERGFAYKFQILPNGQRHIADFFGPGAICNWSRLNAFDEQDDLMFKSQTTVTHLDVKKLSALLDTQPGIASVFKRHELARALRSTQRTRAFISLNATEKLLIAILDLLDEYAVSGVIQERVTLPFSQQELADLMGVTPVHVSRTFTRLEDDGIIQREKRTIRLRDPDGIRRLLAYQDYFRSRSSE